LPPLRYTLLLALAFVAGGAGVWALASDDEDESPVPATSRAETSSSTPPGQQTGAPPVEEQATDPAARAEREVQRAVRDYVAAIDDRDGAALCELVATLSELELPVDEGDCAASVSASIGYRDPRGIPVFERAALAGDADVELSGEEARATATVVTEFADRAEPSVEDDVIYLERGGAGWAIAKPSSTLYRAIGAPDVPPDVLAPPG
jgi:hypothetical protein